MPSYPKTFIDKEEKTDEHLDRLRSRDAGDSHQRLL